MLDQSRYGEQLIQDWMQHGVERGVRELFEQIRVLDGGFVLLRYLEKRPDTLMTLEDIAFFIRRPSATVEWILTGLVDLGAARRASVVGLDFYGLTADPNRRQMVRKLCQTLDVWQAGLTEAGSVISGYVRTAALRRDGEPER